MGALPGQCLGDAKPDAAGGSGHQGGFSFEHEKAPIQYDAKNEGGERR
jgi:hypothetical protein